jgi:hypothetical protein
MTSAIAVFHLLYGPSFAHASLGSLTTYRPHPTLRMLLKDPTT